MELVERGELLQSLADRLRSVASGLGHCVLVSGEAGIGKTSLLKELAAQRGDAHLWWGACDALQTPHPLAPLQDIARSAEVGFGELLGSQSSRALLFEAVLTELQQSRHPVLLVIEDVHWADGATLDLLKFLGRRIDRAPCLLVITYRDDELTPTHPLRLLIGELPHSLVTRLDLPRLSAAGVELLARNALRSPAGLHAATHGNPFFVTEVLRYGIKGVPRGVQDLVLARFARLAPGVAASNPTDLFALVVMERDHRAFFEEKIAEGGPVTTEVGPVGQRRQCLDWDLIPGHQRGRVGSASGVGELSRLGRLVGKVRIGPIEPVMANRAEDVHLVSVLDRHCLMFDP